jgi:hypothetical protein
VVEDQHLRLPGVFAGDEGEDFVLHGCELPVISYSSPDKFFPGQTDAVFKTASVYVEKTFLDSYIGD